MALWHLTEAALWTVTSEAEDIRYPYQQLKKRKKDPATCSHVYHPPFGGGPGSSCFSTSCGSSGCVGEMFASASRASPSVDSVLIGMRRGKSLCLCFSSTVVDSATVPMLGMGQSKQWDSGHTVVARPLNTPFNLSMHLLAK